MIRKIVRGVALTVAAAVAVSGCSLRTLDAPQGGLRFSARFTDVQGLVAGHSVQLSDVRIGTVTGIDLDGSFRARVTMELQPGRRLPAGTTVSVARTSLLGENFVRINLPPEAGDRMRTGPFLKNGALITETSVEPDLESISAKIEPVLAAFGNQDLGRAVDAIATAVRGKGPELNTLVKRLTAVTGTYAAAGRDLQTTIDGLGRLGTSLARSGAALGRLPDRLIVAAGRIERDRTELKGAIEDLIRLSDAFNAHIQARHGARLRSLLLKLNQILAAMVRGRSELKSLAASVDAGVMRAPSITYKGQLLAFTWIAGFAGTGTSAAGGRTGRRGNALPSAVERALSPVTPEEE